MGYGNTIIHTLSDHTTEASTLLPFSLYPAYCCAVPAALGEVKAPGSLLPHCSQVARAAGLSPV